MQSYIRSLSREASLRSWLAWTLRLSLWHADSDTEVFLLFGRFISLPLGGLAKSCSRGNANKRTLGEVGEGGAQLGSILAGLSGFLMLSARHRPPPGVERWQGRHVRSGPPGGCAERTEAQSHQARPLCRANASFLLYQQGAASDEDRLRTPSGDSGHPWESNPGKEVTSY